MAALSMGFSVKEVCVILKKYLELLVQAFSLISANMPGKQRANIGPDHKRKKLICSQGDFG